MRKSNKPKEFRPNTKKLYEEYHNVIIPDDYEVHHILPVRLGGTHDISNLEVLHRDDHAAAHLELFKLYGDPKDLCAHHMIGGRTHEAIRVAASVGGKAGHVKRRERGDLTGFQLFSPEKRKSVASKAGAIGGSVQRDRGVGIHVDAETRAGWAKLGAAAVAEQFADPAIQASRGKRGGVKNKGFRWCNDGVKEIKYTATQQELESFDEYIVRNKYNIGRLK